MKSFKDFKLCIEEGRLKRAAGVSRERENNSDDLLLLLQSNKLTRIFLIHKLKILTWCTVGRGGEKRVLIFLLGVDRGVGGGNSHS